MKRTREKKTYVRFLVDAEDAEMLGRKARARGVRSSTYLHDLIADLLRREA
jgi:hypothetical protein